MKVSRLEDIATYGAITIYQFLLELICLTMVNITRIFMKVSLHPIE